MDAETMTRIRPWVRHVTVALALGLVGALTLALTQAPSAQAAAPLVLHVSPTGRDGAAATAADPLRTVSEAWQRIPRGTPLTRGVTIALAPGVYPDSSLPNYWENRHGTANAPILLTTSGAPRTSELRGDLNLYDIDHLRIEGLRIVTAGDVLHCEQCGHVTVSQSVLDGRGSARETYKANQSHDLVVVNSLLRGAQENALDFVAVQRASITRSVFADAGDWCAYVKGGSVDIEVRGNEFRNCSTGGFVAGQGTGLEWMVAPWLTYEATNVTFAGNYIHDTEGAAFGVNGGRNVVMENNVATRVGTRSHVLEVALGLRSCDGNAAKCAEFLTQGAWGTTALFGEVEAFIPNRDVTIRNNRIVNPTGVQSRWQHLEISAPRTNTGPAVGPSPARTDEGLRITGNVIRNGGAAMELGIDESRVCRSDNPTCSISQIRRDNDINGAAAVPVPTTVPGGVMPGPGGDPTQPPAPTAPTSAPRDVRATAGNAAVVVFWSTGAAGATGHRATVTPARGGSARTCTATAERFCVVTGLSNLNAYRVSVVGTNSAGSGPVATMPGVVVPRGRCTVTPPGADNAAMAAAIRARLAADPLFVAEFSAALQQQMTCNRALGDTLRAAIASAIAADPSGPVASEIAQSLRAQQRIAAEIAADPAGPTARRVAAEAAIR